ncbi:MAG TPA: AAA family ATPase [Bacteroidia bacterium]
MKSKKDKANIMRGSDLPAKLKEYGYDIPLEDIDYMPYGEEGYSNKEGILKDGKLQSIAYYDLNNCLKVLEEMQAYDLRSKLKKRGYEIESNYLLQIPRQYYSMEDKAIHDVDIEQVIEWLNAPNSYNLQAKLKERGYELKPGILRGLAGGDFVNGVQVYNLDKVIAFINATTEYNLAERVKERGYEMDADDIRYIKSLRYTPCTPPIHQYHTEYGFPHYDLDAVMAFLTPRTKNKQLIMKKNSKQENKQESFYGYNPADFYNGIEDSNNAEFPIMKWYAGKYHIVPDTTFIGHVYLSELLENYGENIKWFSKRLSGYDDPGDLNWHDTLRSFADTQILETIAEALIEIEDGMVLLLTGGSFDSESATMSANAALYYKEGVHDPSEILEFLSGQYVQHNKEGTLSLLFHGAGGFGKQDFNIPLPKIDFNLNYNDGFEGVHTKIHTALSEENGKGLVLLHGKPGTGKTTYIRYLINMLNKNKIFVPPNLTELLSDPGFIPFLMTNPNCILFVEDAENVLRSREDGHNNQAVSNILNITDGLLSDCLNIQIVATFNTHLKNIDPALLRKGRLIAQYEFKDLVPDRAEKLADSLKVWLDDTEHLTLSDIYAAQAKTT